MVEVYCEGRVWVGVEDVRICISEGIVCGMGGISGGVTGRREMGCFVCVSCDWKGFSFQRIWNVVNVSVCNGGWV